MSSALGVLPFAAKVILPDTLGEAQVDVVLKGKDSGGKLVQTEEVFSRFGTAARAGMFSGERIPPTQSSFQAAARERNAARVQYDCKIRGIDRGAFRILLNVLAESCRRLEPLDEIRLTAVWPAAIEAGPETVLKFPFPGRTKNVPFELNLREMFFESREPLIRMEFQRNLKDEEFDRIKSALEAWDTLIMLGGYLEGPTGREVFVAERSQLFDLFLAEPTVVEHLIYAFEGPEETFNSVINMAVKVHSTICPLASLEIE